MSTILNCIRIHQWIKNFFVFAPIFFAGRITDTSALLSCIITFFAFSFNASSVYILNDLLDRKDDSLHPEKRKRPIASGKVSVSTALTLFFILAITSLIASAFFNFNVFVILLIYFSLNILYSFGLKSIAIVDVFIISIGFVLRVAAGGAATGIEVSQWLFIMTFLLALFLAFAKRYDDIVLKDETRVQMRKSITGYNAVFVSSAVTILSAVLIVAYLLYITSDEILQRFNNKHMYISTLFVSFGLLRYLQTTLVFKKSSSPTRLVLKDHILQITILLWVGFFAAAIYFKK